MTIKIYQMNDCDWVAAENLQDAKKALSECIGDDADELVEDPFELSDEQMNKLKFVDDLYDRENSDERTFKEQLEIMITNGEKFPCMFASSEA